MIESKEENSGVVVHSKYGDSPFVIPTTPETCIVRCISIEKRNRLDQILRAMNIDLKKTEMKCVYSDEEWETATENGKKTYLICSMGNFRIFGGNGWWYSSGPMHKDDHIYKDKSNMRNAMIVLDHELTFIPEIPAVEDKPVVKRSYSNTEDDDDNWMYHPAKLKKGARPPQHPKYNAKTARYELTCNICGKTCDEKEVSYIYNAQTGYTYRCDDCNPDKFKPKRLSHLEKMAKISHVDLDNYSFDGSD